jgi:Holliday junction DNA helicase RuvB
MAARRSSKNTPPPVEEEPVERVVAPERIPEEERYDRAFRPQLLDEYIGQSQHKENLRVFVEAARRRQEPLDHVLLFGPPGLGKTTLAFILAKEMGVQVHLTSGPALEHKGALAGLLTKLERNDVLFIDEIHRLQPAVEETLYPAIEDFQIEIVTGEGMYASSIQIPLKPFTLIGATTRKARLTGPLQSRFGTILRLEYYTLEELSQIAQRSAGLMGIPIDEEGARTIATRSRGTPRIANRVLRRVRDFAEVKGNGKIDAAIATMTCEALRIDRFGLDELDRQMLRTLIETYDGGPTGVETLAATLSEPRDTLEDVVEPYLLQQGFLARTPRGRMATRKAYEHLGFRPPKAAPEAESTPGLFEHE